MSRADQLTQRRRVVRAGLFVTSLLGLPSAFAQRPSHKAPLVGVLWHAGSQAEEGKYFAALKDGLSALGYVDGESIRLVHRFPNEQIGLFKSYAAELVKLKPDVLVAVTPPAALALKHTGTSIPIVFLIVPDPVAEKLVQSQASPGGNITGFSNISTDLNARRLQLFKTTVPTLKMVGLLINPENQAVAEKTVSDLTSAARILSLRLESFEVQDQASFDSVFARMRDRRIDGVITAIDPLFFAGRKKLAELLINDQLPSIHVNGDAVEAGFLMSYGTNHEAIFRRAPTYIDKILKGTSPQTLPVEQPTTFEVCINLGTARTIGVKIPREVLLQATRTFQ